MRKLLIAIIVIAALAAVVAGGASAGSGDPNGTGQPSQSCQAEPSAPGGGNSTTSSGSPFQGASSAGVYANGPGTGGPGTATGTGHITNPTAVSQYDVACYQVSTHTS
jgi:hypothetical protein